MEAAQRQAQSWGTYDPEAARRCVAEWASLSARCENRKSARADEIEESCGHVYRGRAKLGEPCGDAFPFIACADADTTCEVRPDDTVCVKVWPAPECRKCQPLTPCADGICAHTPDLGERCDGVMGDSCAPGSVCDRAEGRFGTCRTPKPAGAPCTRIEECEGFECVEGTCRETLAVWGLACAFAP